jgi:putative inorganic carbon (HCO3(-)) transporter
MRAHPNIEWLQRTRDLFIILFVAGSIFSIALTQIALACALLAWAVIMVAQRRWSVPRTPLDYYFLAYLVVAGVSLAASAEIEAGVNFAKRMLLIPIVYLIAAHAKDRKFLKVVLFTMFGVMTIFSLIGIFKYLSGVGGLQGRLILFDHYMTTGGILMMISLMTFGIVMAGPPKKIRIAAALAAVTMIFPLIFTFTRSSWLGCICGMAVMGVLHDRRFIAVLAVGVVAFMFIAPASMTERAKSAFDPSHHNNIERVYMWRAGIEIIKDNPVTGVGDIGLGEVYDRYKAPEVKNRQGHLHNNFIMFGVTMGIPGLIVFCVMFARILVLELSILISIPRSDWLAKGVALGAVGAFVGFHISGLFEWNFGDAEICMLLWLSVGLALAASRSYTVRENIEGTAAAIS